MKNEELYALARRCLWAAFAWNDHNFPHGPEEYCKQEAKKLGINSFEDAQKWLESNAPKTNSEEVKSEKLNNLARKHLTTKW